MAKIVSDEDYICIVLRRNLRGLAFNNSDLRCFARDYKRQIDVRRIHRLAGVFKALYFSKLLRKRLAPRKFVRIEHEERLMFSAFLLSTDFFDPGRVPAGPLIYRGYDGPPICNPLAQLRDS